MRKIVESNDCTAQSNPPSPPDTGGQFFIQQIHLQDEDCKIIFFSNCSKDEKLGSLRLSSKRF
jgi:hypothetical protein